MSKSLKKKPRYVMLFHWQLDSPAWKDLDPVARAIYVELTKSTLQRIKQRAHWLFSATGRSGLEDQQGHCCTWTAQP